MATFVNPSSGISQVASNVAVAYFVKDCTDKYYNDIVNLGSKPSPTPADFAELKQAYDFFAAMRSGGTFPIPTGMTPPAGMTSVNFGAIYASAKDKTAASDIADKVDTLLKSFDNITIPSPAGGTMQVCVADSDADNANPGRPVSLYDLITNPDIQCVAECESGVLNPVPYCKDMNDDDGDGYDSGTARGATGIADSYNANSNASGITVHVHDHAYSCEKTCDVTGKASAFESIASVGSTNPQATTTAETALDNSILHDL